MLTARKMPALSESNLQVVHLDLRLNFITHEIRTNPVENKRPVNLYSSAEKL